MAKLCFEEPVMTEVSFANAKANMTETMIPVIDIIVIVTNEIAFMANEIAFEANETAFVTNETSFVANETSFVTNEASFMTNEIAFDLFAIVSKTMTRFPGTETIVSVLDTTFSIREKTVGGAPAAVSNHSTNNKEVLPCHHM